MGSSVSKSKKNRQSTSSVPAKKTRKGQPPALSDASVPQNPQQWSYENTTVNIAYNIDHNINNNSHYEDAKASFKRLTRNSKRTSGNNSPNPNNISQPRTSISSGRPSFSLLRGRKSSQLQRGQNDYDSHDGPQRKPILHISAPIIEPSDTAEGGAFLPPLQDAPPQREPRPSMEVNRYQPQNNYVEPPRSTSGAYKAKVPALPISALHATSQPQTTPVLSELPSFPLPPTISTSPLPSGSLPMQSPHLEDSQRLWRESLRNAAEGRKNESGLNRSNSNNSQTSSRLSISSSTKGVRSNKPLSGSTFATSLSSSSSNAAQSSLSNRKRSGKIIEGDQHESSLDARSRNKEFWAQSRSENSSVLSLPGSRYIGGSTFGDTDSLGSNIISKLPSEPSLSGPHSPLITGAISSPSLTGINTLNDRYDNQFYSPRHSQHHSQPSSPQTRWSQAAGLGEGVDGGMPPSSRSRLHKSSARESMSSISTANYQWMDDPPEGPGNRDAANRDSVMMLFDSPASSQVGSLEKFMASSTNPEQIAQQHQEQQIQQHALLKYFFKGNYRAPFDKQTLGSVLDVGCGIGLWMKDMALEFPLTEVHGVDLVVPTRRRRHRVNIPLNTSSPTQSSFSAEQSDQHIGAQSTSSSGSSPGYPYTSSPVPSSPVMMDSMPSNCFFHKADITRGLPFADNTFDYCHIRLVLWGYQLNAFPDLLDEIIRVTKKGGWIEFVDMDPCLKKATETGTRINEWIKTGLIHNNMDPDLVKSLPKFLKEYCDTTMPQGPKTPSARDSDLLQMFGLDCLKISKVSLPFGPWGGKVGDLWQHNFTSFLKELEPMMVDATLSGLIMDQYHRHCLDEMQQMAAEASRLSGSSGAGERITSFDQRICTHKAWMHLIHQLLTDASYSLSSTNTSSAKVSKTAPSSPSAANTSSSIKEMRSYNNFYLIYAQKVDLMELKQQILLKKLEQEILSPSLGAPTTFTSQAPSLLEAIQQPVASQDETFSQQASTLFDKLSQPGSKPPVIYPPKENQMVASLTEGALEDFDEVNGSSSSRSVRDSLISNVMSAGSSVPPTPTSVAALSIRSSSRMSNNSTGNVTTKGLPGTPGPIVSSSGCHSPRAETTVIHAKNHLRREGSVKSGLGSPQPQPQSQSVSESNKGFVPDYFNQVPSHSPASYHQQQYHHHFQQQMNVIKRKPSLLNQVLAPSVGAQLKNDQAENDVLEEEGEGSVATTVSLPDEASERTQTSVAQTDDADSSVILISLQDEDEDVTDETTTGQASQAHSDNDGDNTIEIFNRISDAGESEKEDNEESSEDDDGELQMLVPEDEEVFVMLAPESHRGSVSVQGQGTVLPEGPVDVVVSQAEGAEESTIDQRSAKEEEKQLSVKADPSELTPTTSTVVKSVPAAAVQADGSFYSKRWSMDTAGSTEGTENDGDESTSAAPSELGDGNLSMDDNANDEEKSRSNGAHKMNDGVVDAPRSKSKKKKSRSKKGRKH